MSESDADDQPVREESERGGTDFEDPEPLNRRSLVGLVASVALAVVGLFLLPPLRSLGLSFMQAFWTTIAVEFVALVGVVVSVLTLYGEPGFD